MWNFLNMDKWNENLNSKCDYLQHVEVWWFKANTQEKPRTASSSCDLCAVCYTQRKKLWTGAEQPSSSPVCCKTPWNEFWSGSLLSYVSAWGGAALAAIHTLVGVPGGSLRVLSHVHFASCVQMIYGNGEGGDVWRYRNRAWGGGEDGVSVGQGAHRGFRSATWPSQQNTVEPRSSLHSHLSRHVFNNF